MNISIIGVGVIGNALENYFRNSTDHDVTLYDPPKRFKQYPDYTTDAVFISVPVPTNANGQDLSILKESILLCKGSGTNIFIRSTVLPGTTDKMAKLVPDCEVYHMPEFLSEKTAVEDFNNQIDVWSGCSHLEYMQAIFPEATKTCYYATNVECEIGKYIHNMRGAFDVLVSNIGYHAAYRMKADWNFIAGVANSSGNHSNNYWKVPGHDGKFGFGGTCFPKDLEAYEKWIRDYPEAMILRDVISWNKHIRDDNTKVSPRFIMNPELNIKDLEEEKKRIEEHLKDKSGAW